MSDKTQHAPGRPGEGDKTTDAIGATRAVGFARHTPGPWIHYAMNGGGIAVEIIDRPDGGRKRIATVGVELSPHSHGSCSRWYADGWDEANARLIAAAPDLLAACRAAIESLESAANDLGEVQFDQKERGKSAEFLADTAFECRKAILKAEGGAS